MTQEKLCSIEGCLTRCRARGYCVKHYNSWRLRGDPRAAQRYAPKGAARAWIVEQLALRSRVDCWVDWPFKTLVSNGRPGIAIDGVPSCASHLVLELEGSPRPPAPNHCALHSCDTPMCLNPHHLRWGSNKENTADMYARGRDAGQLTAEQVLCIQAEHKGIYGESARLARKFGVSYFVVWSIITGKNWKHITKAGVHK